jgi:hypothetical protein
MPSRPALALALLVCLLAAAPEPSPPAKVAAPPAANPFPGGTNPDGSLRPSPPLDELFTQDAYTEYTLLAPGSAQFRIRYLPEEPTPGATELLNATRGGSEASEIAVYDPRTGKPLDFTYVPDAKDPATHVIHARLARPVPAGGVGRVEIWKTYKDERTYQMHGEDLVWVRSLAGYRIGVILPKGYAFLSLDVAAQVATTTDGRLELRMANPSGQANPLTLHARKTNVTFAAPVPAPPDIFFDDVKTLYDLQAPESHRVRVEQTYTERRPGPTARLELVTQLSLRDPDVLDLDTAAHLATTRDGGGTVAKLETPIASEHQSAHLQVTGTVDDASYSLLGDELVFDRVVRGLRNTVLLPAGWEIASVSQAGTIGVHQGRAFVAFVNLNAENTCRVDVRARRRPL